MRLKEGWSRGCRHDRRNTEVKNRCLPVEQVSCLAEHGMGMACAVRRQTMRGGARPLSCDCAPFVPCATITSADCSPCLESWLLTCIQS